VLRGSEVLTGYEAAKVEVPGFLDVLSPRLAKRLLLAAYTAAGPIICSTFETLIGERAARCSPSGRAAEMHWRCCR
jgi:hypothetical protein